jgi:hypothetical protein
MGVLGRDMARHRVIERAGHRLVQAGRRRGADEPVEDHRDAQHARMGDRPRHRHQFPPAEAAQDLQRIAERCRVRRDPRRDRRGLGRKARVIHAGAAPGPVRGRPTVKRMRNRGGGGRVADPHLACHQKVAPGVHGVPARRQRLGEPGVHRGPWVKSAVGRSSAMGTTSSRAPAISASWLIAAPPALKFATICAVTSAGKALTPRAVTPWLPAKTATCGARSAPSRPRASRNTRSPAPPAAPARRGVWSIAVARLGRSAGGSSGPGASCRTHRQARRGSGGGQGHHSQLSIAERRSIAEMSSQTAPPPLRQKGSPDMPRPRHPIARSARRPLRALACC